MDIYTTWYIPDAISYVLSCMATEEVHIGQIHIEKGTTCIMKNKKTNRSEYFLNTKLCMWSKWMI